MTATSLSGTIAILAVGLAGFEARAQHEHPPPADPPPTPNPPPVSQPAWPPVTAASAPPLPGSVPPPGPPVPSGFERRHRVGLQIGGSGIVQVMYRARALGPLHLEVGAFGAPHGLNVSAGVVIGAPVANRWFPYGGFGGGWLGAGGPKTADGCDPKTTSCPSVTGNDTLFFLHARVGVGFAFGATRRQMVSLDVGGWRGGYYKSEEDAAGKKTESSGTVTLPMAGLAYLFAF